MARKRLTREESKAQTRADVVRAATRLFLRDGFVATSLSAIAEEAGVTKGAVYSNFESKEDLFLTIVRGDATTPATGAPEAIGPKSLDHVAELDGEVTGLADRLAAHGRHVASIAPAAKMVALFLEYNAFALRNRRSAAWVAEHNAAFFAELGENLAGALDVDAEHGDLEDLAAIVQSLYVGMMLHRAFEPERFDSELFARAFASLATLIRQRDPA